MKSATIAVGLDRYNNELSRRFHFQIFLYRAAEQWNPDSGAARQMLDSPAHDQEASHLPNDDCAATAGPLRISAHVTLTVVSTPRLDHIVRQICERLC
jgi:hypothetical protein